METRPPEVPPFAELSLEVRQAVYVVVPAYNEAQAIGETLRALCPLYPNVVVVDDGSSDGTSQAAKQAGATVLRHIINCGQGAALQTGIDFALLHGARYVVTFDADGQHGVADIARLLTPIVAGEYDIVLGSRFLGPPVSMPRPRRFVLRLGVLLTNLVSRVELTDAHNGLRAFSRRAAQRIDIHLDRMAHASEIIDQIRNSGLPYREVPVDVRYTEYSLRKGQPLRGALRIAVHYLFGRIAP